MPADIKFKNGNMKHMLKEACKTCLPASLLQRRDKMGFPVPLREWFNNELQDMVQIFFMELKHIIEIL